MISPKVFISSIFILGLSSQMAALACPDGKSPTSIDYIRRDNNRCEGIKAIPIDGGASLNFISIATRKLDSYGKNISIEVPRLSGDKQPTVTIRSFNNDDSRYQLDEISLSKIKQGFGFSWDSYVLRTQKIPPNSLRGIAKYSVGAQAVYVPTIVGQKSNNYEFVFYSQSRVQFLSFKIIAPDGKIYSINRPNSKSGETIFNWDGSKAPAGRYKLRYVAIIEPTNRDSQRIDESLIFEHNPDWLQ
jgi:hypothetical protein